MNDNLLLIASLHQGIGNRKLNRISILQQRFPDFDLSELFSSIGFFAFTKESIKQAEISADQVKMVCRMNHIRIGYNRLKNYPVLYFAGKERLIDTPNRIGIIGTRQPSSEIAEKTYVTAKSLAKQQVVIVSGLAKGCDKAAHLGALAGEGNTIAVLPCGMLRIFPDSHRMLAEDIRKRGLLIGEYPPFFEKRPYSAVQRNFLLETLSERLLLCQSGLSGGSGYATQKAIQHGKIVYVFDLPRENYGETLNLRLWEQGKVTLWDEFSYRAEKDDLFPLE